MAAGLQRFVEGLAGVEGSIDVDLEDFRPLGLRHGSGGLLEGHTSGVDQDIDAAEGSKDAVAQGVQGVAVGDVGGLAEGLDVDTFDLFADLVELLMPPSRGYDVCAVFRESDGECPTNPGGSADYDGDTVAQVEEVGHIKRESPRDDRPSGRPSDRLVLSESSRASADPDHTDMSPDDDRVRYIRSKSRNRA